MLFAAEKHGRQEPEVVISHHLRYLEGTYKELFYSFRARYMYANSVRQLVTYQTDH